MQYVKLGEICDIVSGGTPSRSQKEYWENGTIPWVKIKDIRSKYVDETEEYVTEKAIEKSSDRKSVV